MSLKVSIKKARIAATNPPQANTVPRISRRGSVGFFRTSSKETASSIAPKKHSSKHRDSEACMEGGIAKTRLQKEKKASVCEFEIPRIIFEFLERSWPHVTTQEGSCQKEEYVRRKNTNTIIFIENKCAS